MKQFYLRQKVELDVQANRAVQRKVSMNPVSSDWPPEILSVPEASPVWDRSFSSGKGTWKHLKLSQTVRTKLKKAAAAHYLTYGGWSRMRLRKNLIQRTLDLRLRWRFTKHTKLKTLNTLPRPHRSVWGRLWRSWTGAARTLTWTQANICGGTWTCPTLTWQRWRGLAEKKVRISSSPAVTSNPASVLLVPLCLKGVLFPCPPLPPLCSGEVAGDWRQAKVQNWPRPQQPSWCVCVLLVWMSFLLFIFWEAAMIPVFYFLP